MSDLAQALMVAIKVHAGQTDKQDAPYLLHVLRVVEAVSDEAEVVAALHDVAEDGDLKLRDVAHRVGLRGDELQALALLTRGDGETYGDYIACIQEGEGIGGELAREVKLADLRDNLGRIPADYGEGYDREWGSRRRRYERAIDTLEASS